jgi:hypothetical protein
MAEIQAEKLQNGTETSETKTSKAPDLFFHLPPSLTTTTFPEPSQPQTSYDGGRPFGDRPMGDMDQSMPQFAPPQAPPGQPPPQMPHSMTPFEQPDYPTPFHSLTFATLGRGPPTAKDFNMSPMNQTFTNGQGGAGSDFLMTPMNASLNVGIPNHAPSNMASNSNQNQDWAQWPTAVTSHVQSGQSFMNPPLMSSQSDMSGHGTVMGSAMPAEQNQPWPDVLTFGGKF